MTDFVVEEGIKFFEFANQKEGDNKYQRCIELLNTKWTDYRDANDAMMAEDIESDNTLSHHLKRIEDRIKTRTKRLFAKTDNQDLEMISSLLVDEFKEAFIPIKEGFDKLDGDIKKELLNKIRNKDSNLATYLKQTNKKNADVALKKYIDNVLGTYLEKYSHFYEKRTQKLYGISEQIRKEIEEATEKWCEEHEESVICNDYETRKEYIDEFMKKVNTEILKIRDNDDE